MIMSKRTGAIFLAASFLLVAIYFGLDTTITDSFGRGASTTYQRHTDWGKVVLSLIFGALSILSLAYSLFRNDRK